MRIKLDIPLMLWELAKFTSGINQTSDPYKTVTHITTDSRLAEAGDLFVPIIGARYDGRDFISEALSHGAYVISDKVCDCGIIVKDINYALLKISHGYKGKLKKLKYTIAVTGSVGKSTTKEFIRNISAKIFKVHSNDGNLNNTVGVPISVLRAPSDTEVLVIEAGMNHFGELDLISNAVNPSIAVITNIGTAHIGNFGSIENIALAKKEIIKGMSGGFVIVPYGENSISDIDRKITVGVGNPAVDYCIMPSRIDADGSSGLVLKNGASFFDFTIPLAGQHILSCLVNAVAVADIIGTPQDKIKEGIEELCFDNIRQRYIHFKDFTVYDDSYNSSPEALNAAFSLMSLDKERVWSALLGDMLELGKDTERLHFNAGVNAVKYGASKLYLFGVYAPFIMRGAVSAGMRECDIFINNDTSAPEITAKQIYENRKKGEIILFKASHSVKLFRVCECIKLLEG